MLSVSQKTLSVASWLWRKTLSEDHKQIAMLYVALSVLLSEFWGLHALFWSMGKLLISQSTVKLPPMLSDGLILWHLAYPLMVAVLSYLIPLMIGARKMAFPRLLGLGFWCFVWGSFALIFQVLFEENTHSSRYLAIVLLSMSSGCNAISYLVTIKNMRTSGMTMSRLPLLIWAGAGMACVWCLKWPLETMFAVLQALANQMGEFAIIDNPIWRMFMHDYRMWNFHPEVMVLVLPSFGIIFSIFSTFSKKRTLVYTGQIFLFGMIILLLIIGWWRIILPIPENFNAVFLATVLVSFMGIQSLLGIFSLSINKNMLNPAMILSLNAVTVPLICILIEAGDAMFKIAYTDIILILAPVHVQLILISMILTSGIAAIYFWFPKATGRHVYPHWSILHVILHLAGVYLSCMPVIQSSEGIHVFTEWVAMFSHETLVWVTMGLFCWCTGYGVGIFNWFHSYHHGAVASHDPWNGRTLEWSVPSPVPPYNFAVSPKVHTMDAFLYEKYVHPDVVAHPEMIEVHGALPGSSIWPFLISVGGVIALISLLSWFWMVIPGLIFMFAGVLGWAFHPE
ncbi:MAG: cbb3-type cytochrome c oxidase subunit I [SAR324 cluster bacterium]|nr:cbb3-type cytochrome c oxidase subunit I [SAR324 cluster bacterium]